MTSSTTRRLALLTTTTLLAAAPASAYVENFALTDQYGSAHELYYFNDAPAIVLMSFATEGGGDPDAVFFQNITGVYADQGIEAFLINSDPSADRASIAEAARNIWVNMPVLHDEHQLVGEALGVERSGEVFVIDPSAGWEVVYHGPISGPDGAPLLENALDALLAGEEIAVAEADVDGQPIAFPARERAAEHANISYADEIAPILMENCVACHQPGSIGPWHMTSYENVRGFAPMIREVIRTRRMPPYDADPHVGEFAGAQQLTAEEITTLVHWVEAGAPRGEGEDPLLAQVTEAPEWPLGEPDLVVEIPAYDVPATGIVEYQYPAAEWPLEEGRWLRATTFKPGSREAVHHVLSGYMEAMPEGEGREGAWQRNMGTYAVGMESWASPEGWGAWIPPGGAVGFQMHYTPIGRALTDVTEVAYYFYDEEPEFVMRDSVIADLSIELPPNTARHGEIAYVEFPADALLYGVFPHAHYRGQSSSLSVLHPDGSEELLLNVPRYNFNWQRTYTFAEPVPIMAGDKLVARYEYDNSSRNPMNPAPDETIHWGDQSFEEMFYTAIQYRWVDETPENGLNHDEALNDARMFGALDDNIDGRLVEAELRGAYGAPIRNNFAMADANADGALDFDELAAARAALQGRGRAGAAEASDSASDE
ncbi:MAG: redoxin domain-containing protein [Maricaulaceae bacterium]|jgi:hypothetical protein